MHRCTHKDAANRDWVADIQECINLAPGLLAETTPMREQCCNVKLGWSTHLQPPSFLYFEIQKLQPSEVLMVRQQGVLRGSNT